MTQETKYNQSNNNSFDKYLYGLRSSNGSGYTHTRIGDRNSNIFGGSYNIQDIDKFNKKYYSFFSFYTCFYQSQFCN